MLKDLSTTTYLFLSLLSFSHWSEIDNTAGWISNPQNLKEEKKKLTCEIFLEEITDILPTPQNDSDLFMCMLCDYIFLKIHKLLLCWRK